MTDGIAGAAARQRTRFVVGYLAVLLGLLVVLGSFGVLSPGTFFVAAFVGYLLAVELTSTNYLWPDWRDKLRWPALAGYAVVGYLVVSFLVSAVRSGLS